MNFIFIFILFSKRSLKSFKIIEQRKNSTETWILFQNAYMHYLAPWSSKPFSFALLLGCAIFRFVESLGRVAFFVWHFRHRFTFERTTEHLACLHTWPTFRWTLWDQNNCMSNVTWTYEIRRTKLVHEKKYYKLYF